MLRNDLECSVVQKKASRKMCEDLVDMDTEAMGATRQFLDRMSELKARLLGMQQGMKTIEVVLGVLRYDDVILKDEDKSLWHQSMRHSLMLKNCNEGGQTMANGEAEMMRINGRIRECQDFRKLLDKTLAEESDNNDEIKARHRSLTDLLTTLSIIVASSDGSIECSICLNRCSHSDGNTITTLPCGHAFHERCFAGLPMVYVSTEQKKLWNNAYGRAEKLEWANNYKCRVCPNCRAISTPTESKT